MTKLKLAGVTLAMVAFLAQAPLTALAQDAGPAYIQVRTMVVKNDRIPDFIELQKQFAAAAKSAGQSRAFWQEIRGDGGTYHSVTTLATLADNDRAFMAPMEGDQWQEWLAAFGETIASTNYQVLRNYAGHNIPLAPGAERNLILLRARTVAPGQSDDYREWIESKLIPAIKKGEFKGFGYSRVAYGGNPDTWMSASQYPSWAAMGEPSLFAHLSERERAQLLAPSNKMVIDSEVRILRFRADLSY